VQEASGGLPLVSQERMSLGRLDGKEPPYLECIQRLLSRSPQRRRGANDAGEVGHCADSNHSFDGKSCLVDKLTCKVSD
jgi:hypothetical protein